MPYKNKKKHVKKTDRQQRRCFEIMKAHGYTHYPEYVLTELLVAEGSKWKDYYDQGASLPRKRELLPGRTFFVSDLWTTYTKQQGRGKRSEEDIAQGEQLLLAMVRQYYSQIEALDS